MKALYPCIADRPEMIAFVATLPEDPQRDHLANEYRRLTTAYIQATGRSAEINARIDAIVNETIDASAKDRAALRTETASLAAELSLLPRLRVQTARSYAVALTAWSSYVRAQAVVEHDRQADEVNRCQTERRPHIATLIKLDASTGLREANQERYEFSQAERIRLTRESQLFRARMDEAAQVIKIIDGQTKRHFGDESTRPSGPREADIERFAHAHAQTAA